MPQQNSSTGLSDSTLEIQSRPVSRPIWPRVLIGVIVLLVVLVVGSRSLRMWFRHQAELEAIAEMGPWPASVEIIEVPEVPTRFLESPLIFTATAGGLKQNDKLTLHAASGSLIRGRIAHLNIFGQKTLPDGEPREYLIGMNDVGELLTLSEGTTATCEIPSKEVSYVEITSGEHSGKHVIVETRMLKSEPDR